MNLVREMKSGVITKSYREGKLRNTFHNSHKIGNPLYSASSLASKKDKDKRNKKDK